MFENPMRGRQARNFTKNVPKILDLKSSSEQIFSEKWRWEDVGCPWFFYGKTKGQVPQEPGFHMIVPIVPVVSNNEIRLKRSYGNRNATQTIAKDQDDWDDLDRLDRVEFYQDDPDDRVNFEAPVWSDHIWKRCQITETIRTIEGYPRNHHSYSSYRE